MKEGSIILKWNEGIEKSGGCMTGEGTGRKSVRQTDR